MGAVITAPTLNAIMVTPACSGANPWPSCSHSASTSENPCRPTPNKAWTAIPALNAGTRNRSGSSTGAIPERRRRSSTTHKVTSRAKPVPSSAKHHEGHPSRWPSSSG